MIETSVTLDRKRARAQQRRPFAFAALVLLGTLSCSSGKNAKKVPELGMSDGGSGSSTPSKPPDDGKPAPPSSCASDACRAVAISLAEDYGCGVMRDGSVKCWGEAAGGGLGRGPAGVPGVAPRSVPGVTGAIGIAANGGGACALLHDGRARCWGGGGFEGYGAGTLAESESPSTIALQGATAITRSVDGMCALLGDGSARCWQNILVYAPDAPAPALVPSIVPAVSNATQLAIGSDFLCQVHENGSAECLGANDHAQLGSGHSYDELPIGTATQKVVGLGPIADLSAGDAFACAVQRDGKVFCWGDDRSGQLGDGAGDDQPTPVLIPLSEPATQVSATSLEHACARLASGAVECWGENGAGQLGNGDTADSSLPVRAAGVSKAVSVTVVDERSCAVLEDGRVLCWGDDTLGELGDESTQPHLTAFQVPL